MKRLWKAQGKEKINKTLWGKMCGHSEGPRKADYLIVAGAGGGGAICQGLCSEKELEEQFYSQPSSLESCGWR